MIEFGGADGFPLIVPLAGEEFDAFLVQLRSKGAQLQFSEFQLWSAAEDGTLVNVALRQKATQSSVVVGKALGPKKGVNGRIPADAAVSTKQESAPWWKLELSEPKKIAHLVLYNQLRRPQRGMGSLSILGRSDGAWRVVYDQANDEDNTLALLGALDTVSRRLAHVLDRALIPKIVVDDDTGKPVHSASAIAPGWLQRRRFEQLFEVINELRVLVAGGEVIPESTLRALRMAADALVPFTRPDQVAFSWFFDAGDFDRLEPRSSDSTALTLSVAPVEPEGFMVDKTRNSQSLIHSDPSRIGDASSLSRGDAMAAPASFCELTSESAQQNTRWELWGLSPDRPPQLVYDSELVNNSLVVIFQVLRNVGHETWPTLHGLLRTLEVAGRYATARDHARFFEVADPGQETFDNSINEIEVRSFIDPARDPVSRSKHGYRMPFRLRDHVKYATGTQFLIELLRRDRRFADTFPAYGTLLGFVREGTFIAHDDDADLIILTEAAGKDGMIEVYEDVWKYLSGRGLTLFRGARHLPGHNLPVAFNVDGEHVHIDIFFSYLVDDQRVLFDVKTNTFEPIDAGLVELGRFVEVQGRTFEIPQRSEELLEFWYGPNWSTPYNPPVVGYSWHRKQK